MFVRHSLSKDMVLLSIKSLETSQKCDEFLFQTFLYASFANLCHLHRLTMQKHERETSTIVRTYIVHISHVMDNSSTNSTNSSFRM